jgi:hypothetical protein
MVTLRLVIRSLTKGFWYFYEAVGFYKIFWGLYPVVSSASLPSHSLVEPCLKKYVPLIGGHLYGNFVVWLYYKLVGRRLAELGVREIAPSAEHISRVHGPAGINHTRNQNN